MTGERILDAAVAVFYQRPSEEISLADVATLAGVSVPTVIRRYGGKDGLLAAAAERESARIVAQRDQAAVGDVGGATRIIVAHYEELGDVVLRLLAEAERRPALREIADHGRDVHRRWCERVFAPVLTGRSGVERDRRLAQLISVTDVLTWKLLRRDRGLSRRQTELAVRELLEPLMGGT